MQPACCVSWELWGNWNRERGPSHQLEEIYMSREMTQKILAAFNVEGHHDNHTANWENAWARFVQDEVLHLNQFRADDI